MVGGSGGGSVVVMGSEKIKWQCVNLLNIYLLVKIYNRFFLKILSFKKTLFVTHTKKHLAKYCETFLFIAFSLVSLSSN